MAAKQEHANVFQTGPYPMRLVKVSQDVTPLSSEDLERDRDVVMLQRSLIVVHVGQWTLRRRLVRIHSYDRITPKEGSMYAIGTN